MAAANGELYCDKCTERIPREAEAWWEVVTWARRGKQSGFNKFSLPKATDSVMCDACMVREKMRVEHGPVGSSLF